MTNSKKGPIVATVVVLVLALAGGVWFFFLRSDAPPAVDLDTATDQLTSTTEGPSTPETTAADSIGGAWVVDSETGDFDFETATGSFAGFRVTEELAQIGSTEAVGRTGEVSGTMEISDDTLQSAEIEVVLTGLESDKPRRDTKVQEALATEEFPTATFALSEPVALPDGASEGDAVSVEAAGDLDIHGVTQPVTAKLEAQLVDGTAVVIGSIDIDFTDFGIEAPSAPVVLSVSNEATVEFQLLFTTGTDAPSPDDSTEGTTDESDTTTSAVR